MDHQSDTDSDVIGLGIGESDFNPPESIFQPTDPRRLFTVTHDNGILLKLREDDKSFELKTNLRSQFRVISFTRQTDSWTDSAGVVRPIEDRRNFDIERLRLIFSGHAFTPELKYLIQLDGDSDSRHMMSVVDAWAAWHFSDLLELQFGKRKVPGSRNWMLGAFDTRLADRPFANEFFRPSRTTGIWAVGDPSDSTHYELMVGQGYNTEALTPTETGDDFAAAAHMWWDPIGKYGSARPTDFEFHDELAVRVGSSWVSSVEGTPGRQLEEADFLRLTDGTRVTDPGALAPGATVESFDVSLLALDAAFKYQGWSANAEYFWRSVTDLRANLPVPEVGLQHGFYVEGGFFILPKEFELNSQFAYVTGKAGNRTSYATGFSYYPRKSQFLKLTVDATLIDGSPVNSTGSDILVGTEGTLVRTQLQVLF
ncbi:MAG: hypothetical protein JNL58_18070 [Planctomyces sp.]|nr:hypothetical protein [Planctomyces sp.]